MHARTWLHDQQPLTHTVVQDFDMAILGSAAAEYDEYVGKVRLEWPHLDDTAWRAGRGSFLRATLESHDIYYTPEFKQLYEPQARHNLHRELRMLLARGQAHSD
jgi:predicted metal-dependent HD superfamily phosphohydrolase